MSERGRGGGGGGGGGYYLIRDYIVFLKAFAMQKKGNLAPTYFCLREYIS